MKKKVLKKKLKETQSTNIILWEALDRQIMEKSNGTGGQFLREEGGAKDFLAEKERESNRIEEQKKLSPTEKIILNYEMKEIRKEQKHMDHRIKELEKQQKKSEKCVKDCRRKLDGHSRQMKLLCKDGKKLAKNQRELEKTLEPVRRMYDFLSNKFEKHMQNDFWRKLETGKDKEITDKGEGRRWN